MSRLKVGTGIVLAVGCTASIQRGTAEAAVVGLTSANVTISDADGKGSTVEPAVVTGFNIGGNALNFVVPNTATHVASATGTFTGDDAHLTDNDVHTAISNGFTSANFTNFGGVASFTNSNGTGVPDFVLMEAAFNGNSDAVAIQAIVDGSGTLGGTTLTLAAGAFGVIDTGYMFLGDADFGPQSLGGVAFDISDLGLDATTPVFGIQIRTTGAAGTTLGLDPSWVGAAVPEPASVALLSLGGLALLRRRVA